MEQGAVAVADAGRPLELEDRALIERALSHGGRAPAEYCFANLFLFRHRHQYRLCDRPFRHVRGVTYDGRRHVLPLESWDADLVSRLPALGVDCLYPLPAEPLSPDVPAGWTRRWVEADSDYWFDGPAMARMAFSKDRRAQAARFAREHAPVFESWGSASGDVARCVLDGWLSDVGRDIEQTDHVECHEAIDLAGRLGLQGGLVRTSAGEAVAFLLASRREGNVHVVHFAKGRRIFSGAYPWMFSRYAALSAARLLNFEQDLGSPGLAQSKRAFAPIERRSKWRLVAPGQADSGNPAS